MKVETDSSGRLTVSTNSTVLSAFLALCGIGVLIAAAAMWRQGGAETKHLIGAGIGAAMFLGAGGAFFERGKFLFDPGTRTVGWSRRRFRSEQSGRLTFQQVESVVLQRSSGKRHSNLRIALETSEGELPITIAYGGNKQHIRKVAEAIRMVLESKGDLVEDSIRAAVAAGRKFDAVAIAQAERGLGWAEAKALVDDMAAGLNQRKS